MIRLDVEDILAEDAVILIFSCNVGRGEEAQAFVQDLANATGATVFANDINTGPLLRDGQNRVTQDWTLNVVRWPQDYVVHDILEKQLSSENKINIMFPGGIMVEIENESLNADGKLVVANKTDHLDELGIVVDPLGLGTIIRL